MPLPTPLSVPTAARPRHRAPGHVGVPVAVAFALAGVAVVADRVTGRTAGLLLLVAATAALGVAAFMALRAQWMAAGPVASRTTLRAAPAPAAPDGDSLTAELRRLHEAHVAKVNLALDEGRDDLARELADSYTDQALALLVRS